MLVRKDNIKITECENRLRRLGYSDDFIFEVKYKYDQRQDKKGFADYVLLCELMNESCIE